MKWLNDGGVIVDPPKRLKKITGTRFGAILQQNPWTTPFQMWCEITKTYEKPYADNIYTLAGKTIEGKQIDYIKQFYDGVITPADRYGADFFKSTRGDFFPDNKIFGGMWDALIENDDIKAVIECKTTKRAEDWLEDIPEYYALQAALYAYLLDYDEVMMVASILEESDYAHPENYEVNSSNTFIRKFKVSERYPDFEQLVEFCADWYEDMCQQGMSPIPDRKRDAEILKILHTEYVDPDADMETLLSEFNELYDKIKTHKSQITATESRYKKVSDELKRRYITDADEGSRFEIPCGGYVITLDPTVKETVDVEKMKADGIYDDYKIVKPTTYTMRIKEIK